MEAKQNSISKFMQQQDAQFFIPVYQRNYDWKNEHCKQLLHDVIKVGKNESVHSHFIGSIVYIQQNQIASSPVLTIIDGQQRLTTLTLLIAALVKKAHETGNSKLADELSRRFLINEFMDEDEKLKLKPIKKDSAALKYILKINEHDFTEYSRIVENFNYFYENILDSEVEYIKTGIQKLIFIEIALDRDKDDPQKIFQSLNSTGLDLNSADLIRNYILMGLSNKSQNKIYENYWVEIEQNTTESNSKNIKTSDFIRDYLTFKFNSIPNQNKVYEVFKERFLFESEDDLIAILEEIKLYSRFYKYFINPETYNSPKVVENLILIRKLQINVSYPFLLQTFKCFHDRKIDENTLNEVFEVIQSFVWRRFICGVATNALNKIFMDLYKDIDENDFVNSLYKTLIRKTGSQRFPNDEEVYKELEIKDMYNIQSKNRTYFLERLENYGHRIQTVIDGNQDISIEHIFPQKPNSEWKKDLGDDFDKMKKYANTAANLTLSAFNSDLSNSTFLTKRELQGKGYKDSPLRIDKYLASIDSWNIEALNQRKNWIFDRFKDIWKYPNMEIDDLDNSIAMNILDIDPYSVKNRNLDYFIFFDAKYENPSWSTLLTTVAKIMFEREPHKFLSTDLKNKLKLTNVIDNCLRAAQISQTYYIELNLGAIDIVKRTQAILDRCDTDDELIIRLKNNC